MDRQFEELSDQLYIKSCLQIETKNYWYCRRSAAFIITI